MHLWTVEEANAALPEIRVQLQQAKSLVLVARHEATGGGQGGSAVSGSGLHVASERLREMACTMSRMGIMLRDVEAGILDFASRDHEGKPLMLCWQMDEPTVSFCHSADSGFASRRPITDSDISP